MLPSSFLHRPIASQVHGGLAQPFTQASSSSFLTAFGRHLPFAAAPSVTEQAAQPPLQAVSQHTPSAQKPLPHCASTRHVWPAASRQSPSPVQAHEPSQPPFFASQLPGSGMPALTAAQVPSGLPVSAFLQPSHAP